MQVEEGYRYRYSEERQSLNNRGNRHHSHDHSHHNDHNHHRDDRSCRSCGHRSRRNTLEEEEHKLERKEEEEEHKSERKVEEEEHKSEHKVEDRHNNRRRNHRRNDPRVHVNNVRDVRDHACTVRVRRKKDHTQVRLWQAKASQRRW